MQAGEYGGGTPAGYAFGVTAAATPASFPRKMHFPARYTGAGLAFIPPFRGIRFAAVALILPLALSAVAQKNRPSLASGKGVSAQSKVASMPRKKAVEQTPWQMAESARQQLQAIPPAQRTREDYTTVMDAYRLIYHGNPADLHAPESVYNVGQLLADQGATLHDPKMFTAAIGQFEFLRTQYPHSSLRSPALLEEAQVAANNLRDVKLARTKYSAFVEEYPRSAHIDEAQTALKSLRTGVLPPQPAQQLTVNTASATNKTASASVESSVKTPALHGAAPSSVPVGDAPRPIRGEAVQPPAPQSPVPVTIPSAAAHSNAVQDASANVPTHTRSGLASVSAIRHWSTPNYTRVAIDLGDEVQYEAARVPSPDRIFFDLHGTHLAQELSGKAFSVTDDGFLKRIRAAQYSADVVRVVLDVNDVTEYSAFLLPNPYRLIIDIHGGGKTTTSTGRTSAPPVTQSAAATASQLPAMPPTQMSAAPDTVATRSNSRDVTSLSREPGTQHATARPTSNPIVVASTRTSDAAISKTTIRATKPAEPAAPGHAAAPTADGARTLQRALGLKINRIVIDAGHGGHDSGTLGVGGIMEKDVVLDVALRLGKMLESKIGAQVTYTRSDDTFIPLETRTAIANKAEADLFISIHANSSQDESARGVETYYLNFTSQPDALDVAARENAVSDQSVHQLADLVKKITLKDKIDESREFAADVDRSLFNGLRKGNEGLRDRGVKKAPFVVLIGANMPSILTEISFVTNPRDAAQLRRPEYRERIAASIAQGIERYTNGLSSSAPTARIASTATTTNRAQ